MALHPTLNYPAATIVNAASALALSTGGSTVVSIPRTAGGQKAASVRIAISNGAAFVTLGANTSVTAVTGGSIVTSTEALWLNTVGMGAVGFIQAAPGGVAAVSVSACEEGALGPSQSATPGLG